MREQERISIGVGAVVFRGDEVLLVRRAKEPFLGHWSIPGGGLEVGESLHHAARREVREETQIDIEILGLIDVFEAMPGVTETGLALPHTLMIDFAAEWVAGDPIAGDDAAEAEFVAIEEALMRLKWEKTREAIQRALEIRRAATNSL